MVDVFISYARAESVEARRIKDLLEGMGLQVFFDVEGIDGGDVFPDVFDNAIKKAGVVLSLWSPLSLTRPWVKKECYIGQTRGVLLPVAIAPLNVPVDVPAVFMDTQFLDLTDFKGDPADPKWRKVVRSLARTLKRPDLIAKDAGARDAAEDHSPHVPAADPSAALRAEIEKMRADLAELRKQDDDAGEAYDAKDDKRVTPQPDPKPKPAPVPNPVAQLLGKLPPALRKPPAVIGGVVGLLVLIAAAVLLMQPKGGPAALIAELKSVDMKAPGYIPFETWSALRQRFSVADFEAASDTSTKAALLLAMASYRGAPDVPINWNKAKVLNQQACSAGDIIGCNNLGAMYADGGDFDKATPLYEDACGKGLMVACSNVGLAYSRAQGKPRDDAKADEMFKKSCDGGYSSGCYYLGLAYEHGIGVDTNTDTARGLYEKACDGKEYLACDELGAIYEEGVLVRQDYDKAFALYTKSCDHGMGLSCGALGRMFAVGKGDKRDFAKAKTYFTRACDMGAGDGCRGLGQMYLNGDATGTKDLTKALSYLQTGCENRDAYGCSIIGDMYFKGTNGMSIDNAKAFDAYFLGCAGAADSYSCDQLANLYSNKRVDLKSMQRVVPVFEQICQQTNDGKTCSDLGAIYARGDVVPQDLGKARTLFQKACDLRYQTGCDNRDSIAQSDGKDINVIPRNDGSAPGPQRGGGASGAGPPASPKPPASAPR